MIWRRKRESNGNADEVPEYWITYSDLMVSLLMTFALLLFLALAKVQADVKRAEVVIDANRRAIQVAGGALGEGTSVTVDSLTGTLTLNAEVLFAYGSARLRESARADIERIATQFFPKLLAQPSVDSLIEAVLIEGHTDTVGSYLSNLRLSQDRALSVMTALVESSDSMPYADRMRQLLVAAGRSKVDPVYVDSSIDAARSRRIEIRIRFRDDAILQQVIEATRISSDDAQ